MVRKDHLNLLRKLAWSFHESTRLPFEDFYSEAVLAYCEALESKKFNRNRGIKFTTWLWMVVRNKLVDYLHQEQKHLHVDYAIDFSFNVEYEYFAENNLSSNQREMIQEILEYFEVFDVLKPKFARGEVIRRLRDKNWTEPLLWDTLRSLRKEINQIENLSIII